MRLQFNQCTHVVADSQTIERKGVARTFPTGGLNLGVTTFDGANVWVVNKLQNTLAKIRASDGALLGTFATPTNVSAMAFDGTSIWTANRDDGTLSRIDPTTGVIVATVQVTGTLGVGAGPTGVAFDGLYLWVVAFEGGKV